MLPLLLAVAPLGLIVGVQAAAADLPAGVGAATGFTIYGASAQLAAIDLLGRGVSPVIVVVTVAVINVRLALYSAAMAPHWAGMGTAQRVASAYLLVDPSYAVGVDGYHRSTSVAEGHVRYLTAGLTLWVGWQALITVGMTIGARVPAGLHLELAVPLCLLALVAQRVDSRRGATAVAVAGGVAVVAHGLPLATGLVLAILAGAAVAARRRPELVSAER